MRCTLPETPPREDSVINSRPEKALARRMPRDWLVAVDGKFMVGWLGIENFGGDFRQGTQDDGFHQLAQILAQFGQAKMALLGEYRNIYATGL